MEFIDRRKRVLFTMQLCQLYNMRSDRKEFSFATLFQETIHTQRNNET